MESNNDLSMRKDSVRDSAVPFRLNAVHNFGSWCVFFGLNGNSPILWQDIRRSSTLQFHISSNSLKYFHPTSSVLECASATHTGQQLFSALCSPFRFLLHPFSPWLSPLSHEWHKKSRLIIYSITWYSYTVLKIKALCLLHVADDTRHVVLYETFGCKHFCSAILSSIYAEQPPEGAVSTFHRSSMGDAEYFVEQGIIWREMWNKPTLGQALVLHSLRGVCIFSQFSIIFIFQSYLPLPH